LTIIVVFFFTIGGVNFDAGPKVAPSVGTVIALLFVGCAIVGGGGPLTYVYNASDWSRYMPSRTSSRSIFWNVTWSGGAISLLLCVMGVLLSTRANLSDPVGGMRPLIPEWLFIIFAVSALGGSVSANVITFYGSGLTLQAIGIPLRRYKATMLDLTFSTLLVLYVLFVSTSFTTDVDNFVALIPVWLAPFAGVWLTDGLMRRWHYDATEIHDLSATGPYWGWKGVNVAGFVALLVGAGFCVLCVNSPVFVGPVSKALSGADLTWLLGVPIAGSVYWALAHKNLAGSKLVVEDTSDTVSARVSP
jgi:NCS1 family nucleobase:cation symporter-1